MSEAPGTTTPDEVRKLAELVDRVATRIEQSGYADLPAAPTATASGEDAGAWVGRVHAIRELHNAKALAAVTALEQEGPRVFVGQGWPQVPGPSLVHTTWVEIEARDHWPAQALELAPGYTVPAPVPVPAKAPEPATVPLLVQQPRTGETHGAVVVLHGGGFWMGGGRVIDELGAQYGAWLADREQLMVITPDYRLAPEYPFPRSSSDALTVLGWLTGQGFPPERVVLHGISSGGNCAAATAMAIRATDLGSLAGLVLEAPSLDLPASVQPQAATPEQQFVQPTGRQELLASWRGANPITHPLLAPGCVRELTGMPPTLVLISEQDEIARGGSEFAALIRAGGGRAETVSRLGTHTITSPAVRAEQWQRIARFVRQCLTPPEVPAP